MNDRIGQLRLDRTWTQAELAAAVGISRAAVSAIEGERLEHFQSSSRFDPEKTPGIACCDPAASLLAGEIARQAGLRR